jgi:hypothetical protein
MENSKEIENFFPISHAFADHKKSGYSKNAPWFRVNFMVKP